MPDSPFTLYCPHCDYNLTGLPENRCPECGNTFDQQALARDALDRARWPRGLWRRLLIVPALSGVLGCLVARAPFHASWLDALLPYFALGLILYAIYASVHTAWMMERSRRDRAENGLDASRNWGYVAICAIVAFAFQCILSAASCIGGFLIAGGDPC